MNKQVFISGATGGLGKAFAVECALRGWDVFLTDLFTDKLDILSTSLTQTYDMNARFYACDLINLEERNHLFEHIDALGFKFHMLINVAGVEFEGFFRERSRDDFRTIIRLNIESTLDVTHSFLNWTVVGEPFNIINVSSLAAFYPMPVKATYAASKRFLLDFSLALRNEIREQNGIVTVLCPAGLPTTPKTIRAIQAQGLMGQVTTMDIGTVAKKTIDCALKGKAVYIPGGINYILQLVSRLVPPMSLAKLIGSRWKDARKKQLVLSIEDF